MYLLFTVYGAGPNDFDAGNIHYKSHWKGWALKIETFCRARGPEMATSEASVIFRYIKFVSPLTAHLLSVSVVMNEFILKQGLEKVWSTCSLNLPHCHYSYKQYPAAPCFFHRVLYM